MSKKIWIGIGIVVIIAIALFTMRGGANTTGNVISSEEDIKIPLSGVTEQAQFYNYNGIKYFAVKASNGDIKTAFDACDVCGGRKGYRQEGTDMICNNCGRYFAIDQLGSKNIYGGGCWPGYLAHTIGGDYVVIKTSDLKAGGYQF
jgi:uncharacterized membrane protein